jgi:hypothetical protein
MAHAASVFSIAEDHRHRAEAAQWLRFVTQSAAPAAKPNLSLKLQLPASLVQAGAKASRWAA